MFLVLSWILDSASVLSAQYAYCGKYSLFGRYKCFGRFLSHGSRPVVEDMIFFKKIGNKNII